MNDEDFNWGRIQILFPQFFEGSIGEYQKNHFPKGKIGYRPNRASTEFLLNDFYVEIFMNNKIPKWMYEDKNLFFKVSEKHEKLSRGISKNIQEELITSLSWLEFMSDKRGDFKDHVDFRNEGNHIRMLNPYTYKNPNDPTNELIKLKKYSKNLLTKKGLEYYSLAQSVISGEGNSTNSIIGLGLTECLRTASQIYKAASEIKELFL